MNARPVSIDALLEEGDRAIAHARALVSRCLAFARSRGLDAHHRMPRDPDETRAVVDLILTSALCRDCLVLKTGLSLPIVTRALTGVTRHYFTIRTRERCSACGSATVVHRLG